MSAIDRRKLIGGILCGALVAAGLGLSADPTEAQVVVAGPRHRRH